MRAIDRKLIRDLRGMRGQVVAIVLVIVSGVAVFVAMIGVMLSLQHTLDDYYRDYRFADGFASVRRAPESLGARLRGLPGVADLETRVTAPVSLEIHGFDEPVSGLLVSVPEGRQPELNRLVVREGRLVRPGREAEVVLNELFAEAHDLHPGARVTAIVNGRRRALAVVGIALSPEYLLQVQPGTLFPDPKRYGVLWMGRTALSAAYDMEGAFNDVAFTVSPGATVEGVIARMDLLLAPYGGTGAVPRRDQASNFFIHEEFRQLRSMATMLPAIFLAVAVFLLNVVVSRLISLQREQIGVLKAFGYTDLAVGIHYLKLVLLIAFAGAIVGTLVGAWLGSLMGGLYLEYYRFPTLEYELRPAIVLTAVLLTTGAAAAGAIQAVRRAVRLPPAIAMRGPPPARYHTSWLERVTPRALLDQPTRIIARNISRRPVRAGLTVLGIGSSCAILVMGLFFGDAFYYVLRAQYGVAEREDLSVTFIEPTSAAAIQELASLPGVQRAEPFRSVPVRIRHEQRRYDTTLEGIPPDARLRRIIDARLRPVSLPVEGIVLTERLAQILRVRPGDSVLVDVREGDRRTRGVPVAGLTRQFIGVAAYMDMAALNRLAGTGHAVSGANLMRDPAKEPALMAALRERPRVMAINSIERAIAGFRESYDRSMLTFAFVLCLFAGVIAFGVVYNSARISLSERDRELASLRVLGFTRGEVSYILLGELAVLLLAAIPVGFGLGALISIAVARAVETDLYHFPVVITRRTLGISAAVVLAAAAISAAIVRLRLNRLDLVGVLKTRE